MFDQKTRANDDVLDGTRPIQDDGEKEFDTVLQNTASQRQGSITSVHDAVFGDVTEGGPNYRSLGWLGTAFLMMKSMIGLGVLSIPAAFDGLGLIPGVICMLCIAVITTWSDYMIGVFKLKHPEVYGIDDVGGLLAGRTGYWIMGGAFCLYWIFVAGSAMLSISIALNALSLHGTCTAVFVAVAAIGGFLLSSIQTLGRISWLAWFGVITILIAIFTVTIGVAVEEKPSTAPPGEWKSDYKITNSPGFAEAASSLSSLVFAYAGTPSFFSIVSEMKDPRKYTRSLFICQSVVTIVYLIIGIVVYYYCGSYVASPALGSAGQLIKRISYGLALPGLCVTMTLVIHLPAKYVFIRMMRGTKHLASNTMVHWISWLGCTAFMTLVSYVVASAIPVFGGLVSLVGALLGTLLSFQPYGLMWLHDNWALPDESRKIRWKFMVGWCIFVILSGSFLLVAGTYGSIVGIMRSFRESGGTSPWTCADNSNSS
ncbi:amino acid transporter [Hortaea werneckii]|nr:amino acid transporter [Hortaea werneckii]KAI7551769.1 amino acid transporter [Hortaea werneckii]